MACRVTKIGPFTRTVVGSGPFRKDQMVRDWDKQPGTGQKIAAEIKREAQGQTMVPKGAGVMRPTKR